MSAILGTTIGTVVTWPLVGFLIETNGWSYGFYAPALILLIFTILWYFIVFDSPATHPRIDPKEKDYIESFQSSLSNKKVLLYKYFFNLL